MKGKERKGNIFILFLVLSLTVTIKDVAGFVFLIISNTTMGFAFSIPI